jgi:hypothetical protein
MVVGAGKFPRGAKAPRNIRPSNRPDRADVLARIHRDVARHRSVGAALEIADRDRLWIPNPFRKGWHYSFPEVLRMQAVHIRHHFRQIEEIADQTGDAPNTSSSSDSSRT